MGAGDFSVHYELARLAEERDNLALALCQAKRVPEAIEQFQAALAIDPRDESARNALEKLQGAPP